MPKEIVPLIPFAPTSWINNNPWDSEAENVLWLLTPIELEVTPRGIVLTSIMGDTKVAGTDKIDTDTRFGYTAYGLTEDQFKH